MPCNDWGSSGRGYYEDTSRVDKLARIACNLARAIEKHGLSVSVGTTKETQDWWQQHKRHDEARAKREQQERARQQERRKILAKLTLAERKAIGVEM